MLRRPSFVSISRGQVLASARATPETVESNRATTNSTRLRAGRDIAISTPVGAPRAAAYLPVGRGLIREATHRLRRAASYPAPTPTGTQDRARDVPGRRTRPASRVGRRP